MERSIGKPYKIKECYRGWVLPCHRCDALMPSDGAKGEGGVPCRKAESKNGALWMPCGLRVAFVQF